MAVQEADREKDTRKHDGRQRRNRGWPQAPWPASSGPQSKAGRQVRSDERGLRAACTVPRMGMHAGKEASRDSSLMPGF